MIRRAVGADAAVVAALIRRSFLRQSEILGLSETDYPNYVGFETETSVLRRMAAGGSVALADREDECIGTVSWTVGRDDLTSGDIMRLAVLPSFRGAGHGRSLMAFAEAQLMAAGVSVARLSVVSQFEHLREYYEQMGYAFVDVRRVSSLPFELTLMAKRLRGGAAT